MRKNRQTGFTLIELLVVISVIGILAALIMVNFNAARERARDVQRKSDLDQLKKALRLYYNDNNEYPVSLPGWGTPFESSEVIYMRALPEDPSPGGSYAYYRTSCSNGVHDFRAVAVLENKADEDINRSHARCDDDCGFTWDSGEANQYVVCAD